MPPALPWSVVVHEQSHIAGLVAGLWAQGAPMRVFQLPFKVVGPDGTGAQAATKLLDSDTTLTPGFQQALAASAILPPLVKAPEGLRASLAHPGSHRQLLAYDPAAAADLRLPLVRQVNPGFAARVARAVERLDTQPETAVLTEYIQDGYRRGWSLDLSGVLERITPGQLDSACDAAGL